MQFVPVPKTCLVELRYTWQSQYVENTLAFKRSTDYDASMLQDIADKVADWWYTYLRTVQNGGCVLRETYARSLHDINGPTYTSSLHSGSGGTASGYGSSACPSSITLSVTFRTAGRGRSFRGRNFATGMMTGMTTSTNYALAAWRANLLLAYQRLLPGGLADPTPHVWCVVSRWKDKSPRTTGISTPITSVIVANDILKSQRRRMPGHGT
jgi:hypothetical protein